MEPATLSVIIPAWNEEAEIGRMLETVCGITAGRRECEVIVSVAGNDNTASIAAQFPVSVCHPEKGRAIQMNAGAAEAKGRILYFLHADTIPPPSFPDDIMTAVDSGHPAGCFQMQFNDPDWLMNLYGWFTRLPLAICRGGDQSLFITRTLFDTIGGFDETMQVMEDIAIIERIGHHTGFHILDRHVTTSARKYLVNGRIELQAKFGMMHLLYSLGFSQDDLVKFYRNTIT